MLTYGTGAPLPPGCGVWGYDHQTHDLLALRGSHCPIVGRGLNGATMTNNEILAQLLHLVDKDTQQGGAAVLGNCGHCGEPLRRKSRNGRFPKFCSSGCRVANWRQKQKAKRQ